MELSYLDRQLEDAWVGADSPSVPAALRGSLASTMYREIASLDEITANKLRQALLVPPERYVEELSAFQAWMDIAHANSGNPIIVRAQVMTELYVAFVWLRDSVLAPARAAVGDGTVLGAVEELLRTGDRRKLRNAVAHGRWCYLADFGGLECWAEPRRGRPHQRFVINSVDLGRWQLLSRGTAIAVLLALTEDS